MGAEVEDAVHRGLGLKGVCLFRPCLLSYASSQVLKLKLKVFFKGVLSE